MQPSPRPRTILLPRRALLIFLACILAAFLALPALADHIGPHRTTSTWVWERLACHYEAVYDPPDAGWYGCTLDLFGPPDSTCDSTGSVKSYFNSAACGWPASFSCETLPCDISRASGIQSCSEGDEGCRAVEKTSSLPPATISGSVTCAVSGSRGWCRGEAELSISGSEPLAGYSILALEGTRNGETFACSGAACSVPLLEGANDFTFWARSSYGDTSDMGSAGGSLDSYAPSVSGEVTGTPGDGGWFVSEAILTAGAGDPAPGSGLASLEVSVDGGGWAGYYGALTFSDGEHTVDLRASDAAGNTATLSQAVRIDTLPPEIDMSAGASFCPGCGETLEIGVEVQDVGSGVVEWTLSAGSSLVASGSSPTSQAISWNGGGLGGGSHTLILQARDASGNSIETTELFDLIVPAPPPEPPSEESSSGSGQQSSAVATTPTVAPKPTPTRVLLPTRTPVTVPFGGLPAAPLASLDEQPAPNPPSGILQEPASSTSSTSTGVLWGAVALALIAGATAYGLDQARQRKEKEARLRLEMEERNAAAQAREVAHRAALAAAAAVAAAKAAQEIQARSKVQYLLAQYRDHPEQLGSPTLPFEDTASWRVPDPELNTTYQLGRMYSSLMGASELSVPLGTGTPSPTGTEAVPIATPSPVRLPYPPGFQPLVEPWPRITTGTVVDGLGYLTKYGRTGYHIREAWPLRFVPLDSGKVGVRISDLVPSGEKLARRLDLEYAGTRYNVGTLGRVTSGNLIRGAARNAGMAIPLFTTLASNIYEFGWGSQREKGIWSNEFAASAMVDFGAAALTGLAAAGTAALILAGAGAFGLTAVATAPLALVLGATAILGLGIGWALDQFVDTDRLKADVANGLSAWGGIARNVATIAEVVGQRVGGAVGAAVERVQETAVAAAETVTHGIQTAAQAVSRAAERTWHAAEAGARQVADAARAVASAAREVVTEVVETVQETVGSAVDAATGFFQGLFGGGDS